jgi:hypothetical protein
VLKEEVFATSCLTSLIQTLRTSKWKIIENFRRRHWFCPDVTNLATFRQAQFYERATAGILPNFQAFKLTLLHDFFSYPI